MFNTLKGFKCEFEAGPGEVKEAFNSLAELAEQEPTGRALTNVTLSLLGADVICSQKDEQTLSKINGYYKLSQTFGMGKKTLPKTLVDKLDRVAKECRARGGQLRLRP